jgi:hypothetical protein
MTRAAVTAALVLAALPASAAGDHELLAAQEELRIARDHLEAAGPDYQGHRRAAMDLIDRASQELRRALDVSSGPQREGKPARRSRAAEPTEHPDD